MTRWFFFLPFAALVPVVTVAAPGCGRDAGGGGDAGTDGSSGGEAGPTGDHPINAADYDRACTTADDCVAAVTGDTCAPCNCPNASIAASAKSQYDGDYTSLHAQCPAPTEGISCAACAPVATKCEASQCVLQKCAAGSSDPHHCGEDLLDGGSD